MKKLIKKLARKVLSQELKQKESDIVRLHNLAYGRKSSIMLPISVVSELISKMPPANVYCGSPSSFAPFNIHVGKNYRTEYGVYHFGVKRVPADPNERKDEDAIYFETSLGDKFYIPAVRAKMRYTLMGIDTEIETWSWDLFRAGIRVIGDVDFERILTFTVA